jgi:import inner membrane translocase subunit TIM22
MNSNGSNLRSHTKMKNFNYYSAEAALHRPVINNSTTTASTTKQPNTTRLDLTMHYLPYPQPWSRVSASPDPNNGLPPNFDYLSESCGSKAAIGVLGGGVMGLLMGVFMGALTDMSPPITMINGKDVPQAPLAEQARTTLRATADKSLYWCKQFAFITGVFGGTECLVEKYRGKHDVWNSVLSGCVTGAAMQAKAGPQASAIGCGGFAAFSLVIDSVMGTHS